MKITRLMLSWALIAIVLLAAGSAQAISAGAFLTGGSGGFVNGQDFKVGEGGDVYELDAFVNIEGLDLNGSASGTSARLSDGGAIPGIDIAFDTALSPDNSDITLTYSLTNVSTSSVVGMTFLSFLDAEIDEPINSFFNEVATTSGTLAANQGYEIDEPGFSFGDLPENLADGTLDGVNALTVEEDVAMAFSFLFPELAPGAVATIELMISEDGDALGPFSIMQSDADPRSTTTITYSGQASSSRPPDGVHPIPEPSAGLLYAIGLVVAGRFRSRGR